jgi:hypothetical protein
VLEDVGRERDEDAACPARRDRLRLQENQRVIFCGVSKRFSFP